MTRFVLAAAAALVIVASPAEARRHVGNFGYMGYCVDRHCGAVEPGWTFRPRAKRHRHLRRETGATSRKHRRGVLTHRAAEKTNLRQRLARFDPVKDAGPPTGRTLVMEARRYLGRNPGGWKHPRLWCAEFMNMVLRKLGLRGTGSALAADFARYGRRVSAKIGAIAVMYRSGGGHVGVVSGFDRHGNPVVISGNHGNRVAESVYPRSRVYAYVMP